MIAHKPKVLVVDDEPHILKSIHSLLAEDFEVVTSTDSTQAVNFLKDADIAVILADQRMPRLNGDEFLAKAREVSDATRILVTGYVDIDALIRAVNNGQIHSYVPKPWEPNNLKVTVLKAATYAEEISQRKKAAEIVSRQQEELARSEEAYRHQTKILRSVLDSMGDGVLVVDETGKIILRNAAAAKLGGPGQAGDMTPISQWSERFGVFVPGTDTPYPGDKVPLARAMRGETADGVELFIRNEAMPDGMFLSVNVRPLRDDSGNARGGVAVARDITTAKSYEVQLKHAKEDAERANRAKSEFLSRMSHELRTPLNSILGFAQMLALAELATQHHENVQHIMKGGYHLLELINEVLDLSRIEAGRLDLSLEPVRIDDAVTEALELVRPIGNRQDIALTAELSTYASRHVLADRQRLKQVLLNLLSNAVKFNRAYGSVVLRCETTENGMARIVVADTGCGIDDEGLKKIFTPFERLGADRGAISGTGLGLALSKRMVEAMGGIIGVESTVGSGSRFRCELPWADSAADGKENERLPDLQAALQPGNSRLGTVLCIEDNLPNLRLIEEIVARYPGVRLLAAAQGRLGLDLATTHRPDWILLDLHLPDVSGEEVLSLLQSDPRTGGIPVTILSADATSALIKQLMTAGAREYLTKPIDVRQLIDLLEATLPVGSVAGQPCVSREERPGSSTPLPTNVSFTPGAVSITDLPNETVEQLRSAIQNGAKARLDELIAAIDGPNPECARTLKGLADRYEYDALTNLLAETGR